jgi:hypoxanthine-guanine phosphoribosyltransferase
MITKEQALSNVKQYINKRNRHFVEISSVENVQKKENIEIPYGKYEDSIKDVYVIYYDIEGYVENVPYFVYVDAETGEVLFTMTPHGYAEDWEE